MESRSSSHGAIRLKSPLQAYGAEDSGTLSRSRSASRESTDGAFAYDLSNGLMTSSSQATSPALGEPTVAPSPRTSPRNSPRNRDIPVASHEISTGHESYRSDSARSSEPSSPVSPLNKPLAAAPQPASHLDEVASGKADTIRWPSARSPSPCSPTMAERREKLEMIKAQTMVLDKNVRDHQEKQSRLSEDMQAISELIREASSDRGIRLSQSNVQTTVLKQHQHQQTLVDEHAEALEEIEQLEGRDSDLPKGGRGCVCKCQ